MTLTFGQGREQIWPCHLRHFVDKARLPLRALPPAQLIRQLKRARCPCRQRPASQLPVVQLPPASFFALVMAPAFQPWKTQSPEFPEAEAHGRALSESNGIAWLQNESMLPCLPPFSNHRKISLNVQHLVKFEFVAAEQHTCCCKRSLPRQVYSRVCSHVRRRGVPPCSMA